MGFLRSLGRKKTMFKVSYRELRSDTFRQAIGKLATCQEFKSPQISMKVGRVVRDVEKELKKSQKAWIDLADPLVARDDKGNFKLSDIEGFTFKEGVNADDARKKIESFVEVEALFDHPKFKLDDLGPAKLSPIELLQIEPMLVQLEAL